MNDYTINTAYDKWSNPLIRRVVYTTNENINQDITISTLESENKKYKKIINYYTENKSNHSEMIIELTGVKIETNNLLINILQQDGNN